MFVGELPGRTVKERRVGYSPLLLIMFFVGEREDKRDILACTYSINLCASNFDVE